MNNVYIENAYNKNVLQCSYNYDILTIRRSKHNSIHIDFSNSYNIDLKLDNFDNDYCIPVIFQHKHSRKTIGYILCNNGCITDESITILIDLIKLYFDIVVYHYDIYNILETMF